MVDHLSRLTFEDGFTSTTPIRDLFSDEQLLSVTTLPLYADIVKYLVTGQMPSQWSAQD